MSPFVHLHVHSEYSLLDGAARIADLVRRAGEHGMKSLALTDHGVMYGRSLYKACKERGIKPIIGCETYLTAGRAASGQSQGPTDLPPYPARQERRRLPQSDEARLHWPSGRSSL